jgi:3-phosphoglycerate kinase
MGLFEIGPFSNGTVSIAKSIALAFWRGSKTLVGGGDTISALKKAEVSENEVTHVSTGVVELHLDILQEMKCPVLRCCKENNVHYKCCKSLYFCSVCDD